MNLPALMIVGSSIKLASESHGEDTVVIATEASNKYCLVSSDDIFARSSEELVRYAVWLLRVSGHMDGQRTSVFRTVAIGLCPENPSVQTIICEHESMEEVGRRKG